MAMEDTNANVEAPPPPQPENPAPPTPPTAPSDPVGVIGSQLSDAGKQVNQAMGAMPDQNRFILVIVLSLIFGGWLGSILNGQVLKGVAMIVGGIILGILAVVTLGLASPLFGLYHLACAVDAILIANRMTKGEKFGDWDFCWKPVPKA